MKVLHPNEEKHGASIFTSSPTLHNKVLEISTRFKTSVRIVQPSVKFSLLKELRSFLRHGGGLASLDRLGNYSLLHKEEREPEYKVESYLIPEIIFSNSSLQGIDTLLLLRTRGIKAGVFSVAAAMVYLAL